MTTFIGNLFRSLFKKPVDRKGLTTSTASRYLSWPRPVRRGRRGPN